MYGRPAVISPGGEHFLAPAAKRALTPMYISINDVFPPYPFSLSSARDGTALGERWPRLDMRPSLSVARIRAAHAGLSKFAKLARSVTRSRTVLASQFSSHIPAIKDTNKQSNFAHVSHGGPRPFDRAGPLRFCLPVARVTTARARDTILRATTNRRPAQLYKYNQSLVLSGLVRQAGQKLERSGAGARDRAFKRATIPMRPGDSGAFRLVSPTDGQTSGDVIGSFGRAARRRHGRRGEKESVFYAGRRLAPVPGKRARGAPGKSMNEGSNGGGNKRENEPPG